MEPQLKQTFVEYTCQGIIRYNTAFSIFNSSELLLLRGLMVDFIITVNSVLIIVTVSPNRPVGALYTYMQSVSFQATLVYRVS